MRKTIFNNLPETALTNFVFKKQIHFFWNFVHKNMLVFCIYISKIKCLVFIVKSIKFFKTWLVLIGGSYNSLCLLALSAENQQRGPFFTLSLKYTYFESFHMESKVNSISGLNSRVKFAIKKNIGPTVGPRWGSKVKPNVKNLGPTKFLMPYSDSTTERRSRKKEKNIYISMRPLLKSV